MIKISSKKELKSLLDLELSHYYSGRLGRILEFFEIGEAKILAKHQRILRTFEYHDDLNHKFASFFYKLRLSIIQNRYSLHIPPHRCGKGLRIMHLGPILINEQSDIGDDCAIHINTAVAAAGVSSDAPTIGNGVVLGVGSVILGGIHIANFVAVGANAVVTKDVLEENIAVAGIPAKKVSNNGRKSWNRETKAQSVHKDRAVKETEYV